MAIPVIDLFAGPGGLGEGFTSLTDKNKNRLFKIVLSIEKDEFAHKTLTLRSFTRQFPINKLPTEYYQFVRGEIKDVDELYKLYPEESKKAFEEASQIELGNKDKFPAEFIDKKIRKALKGEKNFVVIGGPPCQAYSLVGRARRQWKEGLNKDDERVYLYREYYRILAEHRPSVFVMENVKGLLSSKVENEFIFNQIIRDLEDPIEAYKKLKGQERIYKSRIHYKIYSFVKSPTNYFDLFNSKPIYDFKDYIIKSEDFGIPQTRHRVILLGIRSDINIKPEPLESDGKYIPIENVLSGLPHVRSGISKSNDGKAEWKNTLHEFKRSEIRHEIEKDIWEKIIKTINNLPLPQKDKGSNFVNSNITIKYKPEWYLDNNLKGACNHESRNHIKLDLYRYLYASCFAKIKGRSPKLSDFPRSLLPLHLNINLGITENKFADRFRVQVYGEPSKTITSHISKDGHYYIHPDPKQCRSLTVREAARIQTFPDNYFFCGPRTEQFKQVGNAVPPLLAKKIAAVVNNVLRNLPS